ncbi:MULTISPECIES: NAD-dependent epimerase/dehydratase family protein [Nocardiopsidaceae]|jgi:nucleoside-diphosphate-sugar epimerase|uniref:NAD(P)-dependent oxidoreductase n=2 Tax=Nocardiopsidaceae TaxID=83676 RepID=A0ABY6YWA6_9ACTN|nr:MULTISPECIES: NAD(P)-dependent oxidoreductase [Nocardiopsaceae]MEE2052759.1 NAD(P)-dependent oxidoreductase [Nocardiopsis umidischolae]WAE76364.1 NAD(P)-dependent oxidoreductase [Streptomonospora nanhaiensis]
MRVLVTGGSGRLGRSVVATLAERGHDVTSVDTAEADHPAGVTGIVADLLDDAGREDAFTRARPEAVVHLAGIAVPFARPDVETLQVNTGLAWAVLSAAVAHGARSAVAASSPTVYGYNTPSWRPLALPLDEEHPVAPWHAYGLSKAIIEDTVRSLARTSDTCVLSCVRPGYVVAPEEWRGAVTQLGHTMAERLADPALAATSLFNYVDARDAAELFALVVERPERVRSGQVFNAVAPDPLAEGPVHELLPRFHPSTAQTAASLADGRSVFSSEAARTALGWNPTRTWRDQMSAPTP